MRIAALLSDFKLRRLTPDSESQSLGDDADIVLAVDGNDRLFGQAGNDIMFGGNTSENHLRWRYSSRCSNGTWRVAA